jgi:hypothetical protein
MPRDTLDMFDDGERPRGRFGEDEDDSRTRRGGPRVTGASDLIDLTLQLKQDRPLSIGVIDPAKAGGKIVFLPKSQIEFVNKGGGVVEVAIPFWLAKDKGLI